MAQMTVAVALGAQTPDHWSHHLADTIRAGRGLTDERLARLLWRGRPRLHPGDGPAGGGRLGAPGRAHHPEAMAPGHDRPRCAYVGFPLNTGPAVSKSAAHRRSSKTAGIRKAGDILVVDLVRRDGADHGRGRRLHLASGAPVTIAAKATIVAT